MAEAREIQLFDNALFAHLINEAGKSPRRRINYNFHSGPRDNPHRFLNVFLHGSYVTPHRHLDPPKAESFLVLEGWMAVVLFDDAGTVARTVLLGSGEPTVEVAAHLRALPRARGIDLPPGVWHTVAAVTPAAVCYEVKPGPWEPATDKEFAPWAPREGEAGASAHLERLLGGQGSS